jgi:hypothetical protein
MDVMEKRKISCPYRNTNPDSSVIQPVAIPTELSSSCICGRFQPIKNGGRNAIQDIIMPITNQLTIEMYKYRKQNKKKTKRA